MPRSATSLKSLDLFRLVARSGSLQEAARESGLSVSTVSHHLRSLEDSLGVCLLDHTKRPMQPTPEGRNFLRYVEEGLRLLREGEGQLRSGRLEGVRELRLALVDDFDSEVGPELVRTLALAMPRCTFRHHTRPSHETLDLLTRGALDLGVATRPMSDAPGLVEYPLLRDPFVIAVPAGAEHAAELLLAGETALPFLRYSQRQIIGTRIEAQLRRMRLTLPNRFELESNQSLMGMIAAGSGWAITTPASYLRARPFHSRITLLPFPGKGFARTLSLFAAETYPAPVARMILTGLCDLVEARFLRPVLAEIPWLAPDFRLLATERTAAGSGAETDQDPPDLT